MKPCAVDAADPVDAGLVSGLNLVAAARFDGVDADADADEIPRLVGGEMVP